MACTPWPLKRLVIVLVVAVLPSRAAPVEPVPTEHKADTKSATAKPLTALADLKNLTPDELLKVYGHAGPGAQPVGFVRGEVLFLSATKFPKFKTWLSGVIWQGKHISEEGEFINQWAGFCAIHSQVHFGPSWYDGRPSLILDYPDNVPYFGNMRDEMRQIAPGLYLTMVYERAAPNNFRGFIGLELEPAKDWKR